MSNNHQSRTPAKAFNFAAYLRTETVGGVVLIIAAAAALIAANTPLFGLYDTIREFSIGPAALHLDLTIGEWAKDGLLAIFFFVAGLELKREFVIGELRDIKTASLPIAAAFGGMAVPAIIAFTIGHGTPGAGQAWAIPVATDIAFALGVLSLTGSSVPPTARVFLLSLAVVDDLGGIILIATLFTASLSFLWLLTAVALCAGYVYAQHRRITTAWLYIPLAVGTWMAVHSSGIHATIAGVALGLLTRVRCDRGEEASPAMRLEHRLQPWSAGLILPVFAFFAAGVPVDGEALSQVAGDPVAIGVMVGLLVGKFVGILGISWLAEKLGIGARPTGVSWVDMSALALLAGIGFTVSLLIAELSLSGDAAERAKAAIIIASAIAAILAAALLFVRGKLASRAQRA